MTADVIAAVSLLTRAPIVCFPLPPLVAAEVIAAASFSTRAPIVCFPLLLLSSEDEAVDSHFRGLSRLAMQGPAMCCFLHWSQGTFGFVQSGEM